MDFQSRFLIFLVGDGLALSNVAAPTSELRPVAVNRGSNLPLASIKWPKQTGSGCPISARPPPPPPPLYPYPSCDQTKRIIIPGPVFFSVTLKALFNAQLKIWKKS